MKKFFKVVLIVLLSLFAITGIMITYMVVSPKPSVWLVRGLFGLTEYTPHSELEIYKEDITIISDQQYESHAGKNTFDIIVKTSLIKTEKLPTILWIHGGAFVAGDKSDVTDYMMVLANEGYAIININYALGYEYNFPAPLIQIGEAYNYIKKINNEYMYLDLDNLIIGGDSAGAFLAAQFIINNTNQEYASLSKVESVLTPNQIKGAILYCGPYDFNLLLNLLSSRVDHATTGDSSKGLLKNIVGFFAQKIGEAFLGDKNWSTSKEWEILSLLNYVTKDFPPTFITDAKNISFEAHAKSLVGKLESLDIKVTSVFYEAELSHEYQFNLGTTDENNINYAQKTLDQVLIFLEEIK